MTSPSAFWGFVSKPSPQRMNIHILLREGDRVQMERAISLHSKTLVHLHFGLNSFLLQYDPKGDRDNLHNSHENTLKHRHPSERRAVPT